jgi:hypothetical protein
LGVNAHFQNGVSERWIRDLPDRAWTSLLHAKERWSKAISVHLWPMLSGTETTSTTPLRKSQKGAPDRNLLQHDCQTSIKALSRFLLPNILSHSLQGGKSQPKWEQCWELVVYLGRSPKHNSSIALVLDLTTAHVSPQFHLKFETVSPTRQNAQAHESFWQQLCHFGKEKKKPPSASKAQPVT